MNDATARAMKRALLEQYREGVRDTWTILLKRLDEGLAGGMTLAQFAEQARKVHSALEVALHSTDLD